MATFNTWKSRRRHVQSGITEGQALSTQHVLIAFGPPYLGIGGTFDTIEGTIRDVELEQGSFDSPYGSAQVVWPAGLIAQLSLAMQRALIPVPEIGSTLRYTIVGPMDGSLQLGRTLVHGPSLLRSTHASFRTPADAPGQRIDPLIGNEEANIRRNPLNKIDEAPGYENMWWNLNSEVFEQPLGVLIYLKDTNTEPYGAVYLENCNIGNLGIGLSAGQVAISESTSMTFTRVRPVRLQYVVPLLSQVGNEGTTGVAGTEYTTGSGRQEFIQTNTAQNV